MFRRENRTCNIHAKYLNQRTVFNCSAVHLVTIHSSWRLDAVVSMDSVQCDLLWIIIITTTTTIIITIIIIFRQPDVVGRLKVYCCPFYLFIYFLPMHFSQTSCRRRPSNLHARFGPIGKATIIDPEISPCLLYTSPSPRDGLLSRMPSSA